jgi:hypothetical protein
MKGNKKIEPADIGQTLQYTQQCILVQVPLIIRVAGLFSYNSFPLKIK